MLSNNDNKENDKTSINALTTRRAGFQRHKNPLNQSDQMVVSVADSVGQPELCVEIRTKNPFSHFGCY